MQAIIIEGFSLSSHLPCPNSSHFSILVSQLNSFNLPWQPIMIWTRFTSNWGWDTTLFHFFGLQWWFTEKVYPSFVRHDLFSPWNFAVLDEGIRREREYYSTPRPPPHEQYSGQEYKYTFRDQPHLIETNSTLEIIATWSDVADEDYQPEP